LDFTRLKFFLIQLEFWLNGFVRSSLPFISERTSKDFSFSGFDVTSAHDLCLLYVLNEIT